MTNFILLFLVIAYAVWMWLAVKWVNKMTEWNRQLAERITNLENIKFFKGNKPHNYKGKKYHNEKTK